MLNHRTIESSTLSAVPCDRRQNITSGNPYCRVIKLDHAFMEYDICKSFQLPLASSVLKSLLGRRRSAYDGYNIMFVHIIA